MKKGVYFTIIFFVVVTCVSILGVGVDTTKPYHDSDSIMIDIDGLSKPLGEITATNFVFPSYTYDFSFKADPGHNINETWVSVKDGEMTLYEALSSENKLCPADPIKTSYASFPTDKTKPFHYATEIQLSSGKNLQEAINEGDFCYYWYSDTNSCSVTCGGGTLATSCYYKGAKVADTYCYSPKPSISCNTQGCIWVIIYRGCMPSSCTGGCPSITGTPCSPAGSTKFCCVDYGCGAAGSLGIGFRCQ